MISVLDADTGLPTKRTHLDACRKEIGTDGNPMYVRSREEWDGRKLAVYRSTSLKEIVWIYLSTGIAVSLLGYDEDKEDHDQAYATSISQYLCKPDSHYVALSSSSYTSKTVVTTTVHDSEQRPKRKAKKMKVAFEIPGKNSLPKSYHTKYCSADEAKDWFQLTDDNISTLQSSSRKFGVGDSSMEMYNMADCWRAYHGLQFKDASQVTAQNAQQYNTSFEDAFGDLRKGSHAVLKNGIVVKDDTTDTTAVVKFDTTGGDNVAVTKDDTTASVLKKDMDDTVPAVKDDTTDKAALVNNDTMNDTVPTVKDYTKDNAAVKMNTMGDTSSEVKVDTTDSATVIQKDNTKDTVHEVDTLVVKKDTVVADKTSSSDDVRNAFNSVNNTVLAAKTEETESILAQLEAKINELQAAKDVAEAEALNKDRLFKNYKSRQRFAIRDSKHEADDLRIQLQISVEERKTADAALARERASMKTKYDAAQASIKALKTGTSVTNATKLEPCVGAYKELIKQAHKAYSDAATKDGPTKVSKYQFCDPNSNWVDMDDISCLALDTLKKASDRVSYIVHGHTYEARLADNSWSGKCFAIQKNIEHKTERMIQKSSVTTSSSSSSTTMTDAHKHNVLFGNSPIKLSADWVDSLLKRFSFDEDHYSDPCRELAELAELFNSFSNGFKYTTLSAHKTDLYVKPILLFAWLSIAKTRGYTAMRIVLHGADSTCYDGVKNDPYGMDLQYAGMHGQAYGNGFYFGLSDHVTVGYNKEGKPGTALMALILTHEKLHTRHGGYNTFDSTAQVPYNTFQLSAPKNGIHNCIVVHEAALCLILGKVVAL